MENAVLILIFNRPDVAKRTFAEIAKAKPPRLYIACDGARENKNGEIELVNETRKIVDLVDWQCEVKTLFQEKNLGCGLAVSSAITWFFKHEEQGIILEDDCLPNQSFFGFCEELLEKYKNEERVATISGFNYQKTKRCEASYYFSDIFECVGWASWRNVWQNYFKLDVNELDENLILSIIENKPWSKDMKNYWTNAWHAMKEHKVSSWAWPFALCCMQHSLCSAISNVNLISNIGFGPEGTHTTEELDPSANTPTFEIQFPLSHPEKIETDFKADKYMHKIITRRRLINRIKRKLRKWLNLGVN